MSGTIDPRDMREDHRPEEMPTALQVLQDIASEIESDYPLHALWLRNLSRQLKEAGTVRFDRRLRQVGIIGPDDKEAFAS